MELSFEKIKGILQEINKGCVTDIQNWLKTTHSDVYNECIEDSNFNINHIFNNNSDEDKRFTLLSAAAQCRYRNAARVLLASGADAGINKKDENGNTPLHCAAINNQIGLVKFLIMSGADVNARNYDGRTPVQEAACKGHAAIVEYLAKNGAIMEFRFEYIKEILQVINDGAISDIKNWLEKNHRYVYYACGGDDNFNIDCSLIYGDVYIFDRHKDGHFTLLSAAVYHDYGNATEALLASGADSGVNEKDDDGYTRLHWAAIKGQKNMALFLINKGADINAIDKSGSTPLHCAIEFGYEDIAEIIIQKGADVNKRTSGGRIPLHWALERGYKNIAKVLLQHNADVHARDECGDTPLHWAAHGGYEDIVKFLLQHNADVNARGKYGRTPLHCAAAHGHTNIVKILLQHNADIHARDEHGDTPLDSAHNNDVKKILQDVINRPRAKVIGVIGTIIGIVTIVAAAVLLAETAMIVGVVIGAVVACLGLVGAVYGFKESPYTKVNKVDEAQEVQPPVAERN